MTPISQRFYETVKKSHTPVSKAILMRDGSPLRTLHPVSGQVSVDEKQQDNLRSCSATLVDPTGELTPHEITDELMPYGNEIRLERGIKFGPYDYEYVPIGVFRIFGSKVIDASTGLRIEIEGFDRARVFPRRRFIEPYQIHSSSTTGIDQLRAVILDRAPEFEKYIHFPAGNFSIGNYSLGEDTNTNPWTEFVKVASSMGLDIFWDPTGLLIARETPNPDMSPVVFEYEEGSNLMAGTTREFLSEYTYNVAVVSGEATDAPVVRSITRDDNERSATYYLGRYGEVPTFLVSPLITTQSQADAASQSLLYRSLGGHDKVTFNGIPNPAHETGDAVLLTRELMGINARFILESFPIPLGISPGTVSYISRRRRF